MAQAVLILPIVVSLTRSVVEDLWTEYREQMRSLGSSRLRAVPTLLRDGRYSLLTGMLAGFGRASPRAAAGRGRGLPAPGQADREWRGGVLRGAAVGGGAGVSGGGSLVV